jgi:hypothetical protein
MNPVGAAVFTFIAIAITVLLALSAMRASWEKYLIRTGQWNGEGKKPKSVSFWKSLF